MDSPPAAQDEGPLRGFRLSGRITPKPGAPRLNAGRIGIKVRAELTPPDRGADPTGGAEVDPDDLIEVEFHDGTCIWTSGADFRERLATRVSRGAGGSDELLVPSGPELFPSGAAERGVGMAVVKALRVIGVDLKGMAIDAIARAASHRPSLRRTEMGLLRCTADTESFSQSREELPDQAPDREPYLVFIHGTFSSTWSGFGDLWSRERSNELARLHARYGRRIYGFEHDTLLESPIQNALKLARSLPAGAHLHLVSHSRGGLVGELLCRGQDGAPAESAFPNLSIEAFGRIAPKDQRQALGDLGAVLAKKRFVVERFVPVAGPLHGTTLASRRLDRVLSVMQAAANFLPRGPFTETVGDLGEFVAMVIKARTKPTELPGIEAMMPESAFVQLINWPGVEVPGNLTAITGDLEATNPVVRALTWALDRYYDGDHDLVVNTGSMVGGARRKGSWRRSFHQGPDVTHFTYFRNRESAERVVHSLTADEKDLGVGPGVEWVHSAEPVRPIARAPVAVGDAKRPMLVMLPGIMGSELGVRRPRGGHDKVWLDFPDIILGGFDKLKLGRHPIDPIAIFESHYGELRDHLALTHEVYTFPFDWRLSLEVSAERLASELDRLMKKSDGKVPLRILAHSMGGLVVRALFANHPAVRKRLEAQPDFRLIMCGTPNGGSHAITQLLVGRLGAIRMLALADLRRSRKQLIEVISRFPGVLEMLPSTDAENYFDPKTWAHYFSLDSEHWVMPAPEDLASASKTRDRLNAVHFDPEKTVYVAGQAPATVMRMESQPRAGTREKRIVFKATTQGDGTVPWASGIPPKVPTYYINAVHGDLLKDPAGFLGLGEVLSSGRTTAMSTTPPLVRGAVEEFELPPDEVLSPDEESLTRSVLGGGKRVSGSRRPSEPPVKVAVFHGHLKFARFPVVLGHYQGDSIVSAENALDHELKGELDRRNRLGVYPGPIGTRLLFIDHHRRSDADTIPHEALIVGLGMPGSLTAGALVKTLTAGLIEFALECTRLRPPSQETLELGISPLLIGTLAGGISAADSAYGILSAVQRANRALKDQARPQGRAGAGSYGRPVRICEVEFIELYQDRAILAMRFLHTIARDSEMRGRIEFNPVLGSGKGGRERAYFEEPPGWWQRLQILGADDEGHSLEGALRFTSTTRRARSEVRIQPTQTRQVSRFVAKAIRSTASNSSVSCTLFELLLPNDLKEDAPVSDDLVLLLDDEAAGYPWELLQDPRSPEGHPFAIEHGLLRQLVTPDFRPEPRSAVDRRALVIGDPGDTIEAASSAGPEAGDEGGGLRLPPLPQAAAEARAVAQALRSAYDVTELSDRPNAERVMSALFERPYQILHVAGHGVFRHPVRRDEKCPECGQPLRDGACGHRPRWAAEVTGIVLGPESFLTPIEVNQMREVPELVFINCCHLARTESGASDAASTRSDYHLIASGLASAFIKMGVRAVIAAGWAVDDAAAASFAAEFYRHMSAGSTFGDAVKQARKLTYQKYRGVNTWGAYQCYGDHDYRLSQGKKASAADDEPQFGSPAEVETVIRNIAAQLALLAARNDQHLVNELDELVSWMRRGQATAKWLDRGDIATALARAYGEALCLDRAIAWYRRAFREDPQRVRLKDVEQLANLTGRHAVQRFLAESDPTSPGAALYDGSHDEAAGVTGMAQKPLEQIALAEQYLRWLMDGPEASVSGARERGGRRETRFGPTAERFGLVASTYKRRAWIASSRDACRKALELMCQNYRQAVAIEEAANTVDAKHRQSLLFGELALSWFSARGLADRDRAAMPSRLEVGRKETRRKLSERVRFWDGVAEVDATLFERLLAARGTNAPDLGGLAQRYLEMKTLGSRREFASVTDHAWFLAAVARKAGKGSLAAALDALAHDIASVGDRA